MFGRFYYKHKNTYFDLLKSYGNSVSYVIYNRNENLKIKK